MELRFIFKTSSGMPRTHAKRLPILVGRSDAGDVKLRIPKDSVSRRHCEFLLDEEGRVCVRDLESTNGTFLGGRQLPPRVATPVSSGSAIKLGNVGFRVEYEAPKPGVSPHDSDTIPIDAPPEPMLEAEELEPGEPTVPVASRAEQSEPVAAMTQPEVSPAENSEPPPQDALDIVAAEPAAEGDFGFLAAAEPDAPADAAGQWPDSGEGHAAEGDKNLDDFFKGLS